ncbi:uncharacterized protein N7506_004846, partial [Penicillium brevicompactum]|uniref:uncharacterized protein n=1 Tax=Penicillium brevicompactum TaxID=5074 RepID=UPI002540676A
PHCLWGVSTFPEFFGIHFSLAGVANAEPPTSLHSTTYLLTACSTSRRRNGKPASCEPCRRDKVRCDHALPVCTRCRDRGVSQRCFYHPAPLTRPKDRRIFPLAEGVPFDRAPSAR